MYIPKDYKQNKINKSVDCNKCLDVWTLNLIKHIYFQCSYPCPYQNISLFDHTDKITYENKNKNKNIQYIEKLNQKIKGKLNRKKNYSSKSLLIAYLINEDIYLFVSKCTKRSRKSLHWLEKYYREIIYSTVFQTIFYEY